jgi:hypothetical protein
MSFHRHRVSRTAVVGLLLCLAVPSVGSAQIFGGTIRIANNSPEQLNVNVDGAVLGVALPGQIAQFANIPAGYKSILLTNTVGQLRSSGRFFLGANSFYTWTVSAPVVAVPVVTPIFVGGTVQVLNRFLMPANIVIGGRFYGTVFPGQTAAYYNVPGGGTVLTAVNQALPTQEIFRQVLTIVPGATQYVNLIPQVGVVRVANSRPEPVEILIDGAGSVLVQPGQTIDLPNIAVGGRNLIARVAGQVVQSVVANIFPGQYYTFYVRTTFGTIRVINRGIEVLTLTLNGASQGAIVPQQDRFLPNIPMGTHKLLAIGPEGGVRNSIDIVLNPGETRMWVIESAGPPHEPHTHMHAHPHAFSPHHHHEHMHPHMPGFDHHHPY